DHEQTAFLPRYRSFDQEKIPLRIHPDNLEPLNGNPFPSHTAGQFPPFKYPRRAGGPEGTDTPVVHGAVGHWSPVKTVSLDYAGKTFSICYHDHIHGFTFLKNVGFQNLAHLVILLLFRGNSDFS